MDSSNSDIFETRKSTPLPFNQTEESNASKNSNSNFFLAGDAPVLKSTSEPVRSINDYDYNLLEEDAYKDVKDELFKIEYKLSKTEKEIAETEAKIKTAKAIGDSSLVNNCTARLLTLQDTMENLREAYNNKSLSAKITDSLFGAAKNKISSKLHYLRKILSPIYAALSKFLPQKLASAIEIRKSLTSLENINKSVDELIQMNIPPSEGSKRYEQLSKYIIKANSIQSAISNQIKK